MPPQTLVQGSAQVPTQANHLRDLYLHIGLPKTGTSYLQQSLVSNADRLRSAGLGISAYQDPRDGASRVFRKAVATEGLEAVMEGLAAVPTERVVVSSEQLSDWLDDADFARALHRAASRHFRPRIVIFLRRQDFLRESLFAQVVKTWYAGPIAGETHYDYDHDARLRRLEAVFGGENIRVLIYHDRGRNDIQGAFLRAMGLDIGAEALAPVERRNISLHRRKLLFLSQVPKPDPARQDLSRLMTEVVTRSAAIGDDGGRFLMSPAERRELVARHQAGNRAVIARYGIEDARDFGDLPDADAGWRPPRPISTAELAATYAAVLGHCARRLSPRYGLAMAGRALAALPAVAGARSRPPAAAVPAPPNAGPPDLPPVRHPG